MQRIAALAAALACLAAPADAAGSCMLGRADYVDRDKAARVEFAPAGEAATVTNSFTMQLDNNVALQGLVQWTDEPARPNGMLLHECPEGDITGPELERCTAWQGVIYAVDERGAVSLLPGADAPAPPTLIFSDLAYSLRHSSAHGVNGFVALPFDVFAFSGCR